jgi:threonine/homoserine/homoserine lactone efflux protein
MTDPIQFALAALLLLAMPGPTNTIVAMAGAVNRGAPPWAILSAMVGGYLAVVLLARLALLPVIDAYPWMGVALKAVVVAYLVYAAIMLWRTRISLEGPSDRIGPRLVLLTTMLNPKGLIFAIAIIPRAHPQLAIYFAAFAGLALITGGCWFVAGRTLGALAGSRATVLPRLGAVALLGFAGYLLASVVA